MYTVLARIKAHAIFKLVLRDNFTFMNFLNKNLYTQ